MAEARHIEWDEYDKQLQQIIDRLDALHKHINIFEHRLRDLADQSEEADLPRVRFAVKDALAKTVNAGSKLVESHLILAKIRKEKPGAAA